MLHSLTPAATHFFRKLSIILCSLWNYSWDLPRSERYHLFFPAEEIVDMKSSRRIFRVGELVAPRHHAKIFFIFVKPSSAFDKGV